MSWDATERPSSWRWQAQYRDTSGRLFKLPRRDDAATAYADADGAFERVGVPHVAIILHTRQVGHGGVADSRDVEKYGGAWVVGLARWQDNERRAVRQGQA